MKVNRMIIRLVMCLVLIFWAVWLAPADATAASKQTMEAAKVKAVPSGLTDSVWSKAKAIEVPFEGKEKFAGKKTSVSTKAVYTDENIYFLFKWKVRNDFCC